MFGRTNIAGIRLWPVIALLAMITADCRRTRTVKLAWDAPQPPPIGYKILVDDQLVLNIPPPPLDPSCDCPSVSVSVPPGSHTISVVAYNQFGESPPAAVAYVK